MASYQIISIPQLVFALTSKTRKGNIPKSNRIVIRPDSGHYALIAVSRRNVTHDVAVHLVLVLVGISGHVIRIEEVARHLVDSKCFRETHGCVLVLSDGDDADLLGSAVGRETAVLLKV